MCVLLKQTLGIAIQTSHNSGWDDQLVIFTYSTCTTSTIFDQW